MAAPNFQMAAEKFQKLLCDLPPDMTLWDAMTALQGPKPPTSPQLSPGDVKYVEPILPLRWSGVRRIKASKAYKGSEGVEINALILMRFHQGQGEVNDTKRLHSRKDWVVGFLDPIARSEDGKALWGLVTRALLGDFLFMRHNFKGQEYNVRGNVLSFPGGKRLERAGGTNDDSVHLMVTCPARDENGGQCWTTTTKALLKAKKYDDIFQCGQLVLPKHERWPYTTAAVIYVRKADNLDRRTLHVVDILLDQTKVPTFEGGVKLAEVLHQVLHAFVVGVNKGLDVGGDSPPAGSSGKPKSSKHADESPRIFLPECIWNEKWPANWTAEFQAAIGSLGFVKEGRWWVLAAKRCSKCGVTDGDMKTCGGCNSARYCSKECQKAAWGGGHKEECKRAQAGVNK